MEKLGPTGNFPRGKINSEDEGELTMALGVDRKAGVVKLVFGKSVAWLGLPAKEARELGTLLIQRADELEGKSGTT